jgi:hypothetical protein
MARIAEKQRQKLDEEAEQFIEELGYENFTQAVNQGHIVLRTPTLLADHATTYLAHSRVLQTKNASLLKKLEEAQQESAKAILTTPFDSGPDVAPLIRHLRTFGPLIFRRKSGRVHLLLFFTWLKLFSDAVEGNQEATEKYQQICDALRIVDSGAPKTRNYEQLKAQRRKATAKFKERVRQEKVKIERQINQEVEKMRAVRKGPKNYYRLEREKIEDEILDTASKSRDAAKRRASKLVKEKIPLISVIR